jgi:Mannosyl-glycoprotein endo-beta-N-acetylglucosaminidase
VRSVAPYAAQVSRETGIPTEALVGMAANETGFGRYAAGNNLFGIKGTGPAGSVNARTWEDYGKGAVTINADFRAYHSPAESFRDFAGLVTTSPRYAGAVGQTTVEGFVGALKNGGYMTDPNYVQKIASIANRYAPQISQAVQQAQTQAPAARPALQVPDQFNSGLSQAEAYAACGPVAAVAFARAFGRNPTVREAMDLAKQTGWTAAGGMNGVANEQRLLGRLGVPTRLEASTSWDRLQQQVGKGSPVILSTEHHYWVLDAYDPQRGAFHVGQSGLAYRGGAEWMTAADISRLGGSINGALYLDQAPRSSTA